MVTAKKELSTTIRLNFTIRHKWLPPKFRKSFLQSDIKKFRMISQRIYFSIMAYFKIKLHPNFVVMVSRILILPIFAPFQLLSFYSLTFLIAL